MMFFLPVLFFAVTCISCGLVANVCGICGNSIPYRTILSYSSKVNLNFKHEKKKICITVSAPLPPSNWH
jgi:hypothetical protein